MSEIDEFIEDFYLIHSSLLDTVDESELKALTNLEKHIKKEFRYNYTSMDYFDDGDITYVQLSADGRNVVELNVIFFHGLTDFDFSVFTKLQKFSSFYPPIKATWHDENFFLAGRDYGYYCPDDLPKILPLSFPNSITDCQEIDTISIENIPFINLPESISKLTKLFTIELFNTDIRKLPDAIGLLPDLEYIQVSNGHLTEIPETIGNLQDLHTLEINHNPLVYIPESIGKCEHLLSIRFVHTSLRDLPKELLNHPLLKNAINEDNFKGTPIVTEPNYKGIIKKGINKNGSKRDGVLLILFIFFIAPDFIFFLPFLLLFDPYYKKFRKEISYINKDNPNGSDKVLAIGLLITWLIFSIVTSPYIIATFPLFVIWYLYTKIKSRWDKTKVKSLDYY